MYHSKRVSVVLATYREKNSLTNVINSFLKTEFVDEVIVVNNNAEKGTDQAIKKTKAKIIYEPKQGYGYAYQTGIKDAIGDYIVLCEPDGTYRGEDIEKFLVYARQGFDVVFGSRTGQSTLLSGADMDLWRKWANVLEAKSIEILFNSNSLTDVGCTYKLFTKNALKQIANEWRTTNSLFATELLLLTVSRQMNYIEIPVNFNKRVGTSSLTGKWYLLVKWGVRIQGYILSFWLRWMWSTLTARSKLFKQ
jgi:glycosyltransferase involved in cell wall biosynthesis